MTHDQMIETAKAAPPAFGLLAWLNDINLQTWVLVATLIYTGLLIIEKLYKFWRGYNDSRRNRTGSNPPPAG